MKTSGAPSFLKICLLMVMFVSYSDTYVFSKPRGGQVVSGNASFTQDGNLTVITAGNRSIINYQSFDIAKGETVQFVQPGAHSTVLNRVTSADPTNIFGTLQSNGIVVIANPYGVFFQNGSVINVGGLLAGAGKVSAADFTHGKVHFTDLNGDVRNDGVIAADNRIALMGANVVNTGSMTSAHGVSMMVSGQDIYVGEKDGNVFVKANGHALQAQPVRAGNGSAGSVTNTGTVAAPRVLLGAGDMYSTAIVNSGLLQGRSIAVNAGKNGSATVGGTLDASSARNATPTGKGGRIDVLGGTVALKGAALDASGSTGGGTVRVGGDFHGDGALAHAATTSVDAATTIKADATGAAGDGGTVVLWSDKGTDFAGTISTRAGSAGGDGGQVEVSSHGGLGFNGRVDTGAVAGKTGSLLLDPTNIEISSNSGTATTGSELAAVPGNRVISASSLEALLGSTNVTLQATQDIRIDTLSDTIATNVAGVQTANQLTFAAPVAGIGGTITFTAGSGSTTGSFTMDPTNTIVTNGRPITINASGTGAAGGINTGMPFTGAPMVNAANFGILAGTINTSPATGAAAGTAAGAVNLFSTVATTTTPTAPNFPVRATSIVTTSPVGNAGNIAVGPSAAGVYNPTAITLNGALTATGTGTTAANTGTGGRIDLTSSGAVNITTADASSVLSNGRAINLTSTGSTVTTTGLTASGAGNGGGGGNVTLTAAGAINVNGAIATQSTSGTGNGGTVAILTSPTGTAGGDVLGAITTSASGTGNAGSILIGTNGTTTFAPVSLTLNGALTATALGSAGNGGAVSLVSGGAILASATTSTIDATSVSAAGGAITVNNAGGTALTLNGLVKSAGPTGGGNLTVDGPGTVALAAVDVSSSGAKGGNVAVGVNTAPTSISINSGGAPASNALLVTGTSATAGAAAGGNVTLSSTGTVTVAGIINAVTTGGTNAGNAGNVTVTTSAGGTPGLDTFGAITTAATGTGNAGSILIGTNGTTILASAGLTLNDSLSANAVGSGSGGAVNLVSAGAINATGPILTTVGSGAGVGGNVTIRTSPTGSAGGDTLAAITTTTGGTGNAGNIFVGTDGTTAFAPASLTLNGVLTSTASGTAGTGGTIRLVTTGTLGGTSGVLNSSSAAGNAGGIFATSTGGTVALGALTATSVGTGLGGAVAVTANGSINTGAINTSITGTGTGGAVNLLTTATANTPVVVNGTITTTSSGGTGGAVTIRDAAGTGTSLPTSINVGAINTAGTGTTNGGPILLETSGALTLASTTPAFTGNTTLIAATTNAFSFTTNGYDFSFTLTAQNFNTSSILDTPRNLTLGGQQTTINSTPLTTTASQTYNAPVIVAANAVLQAGTGTAASDIRFNSTVRDQTNGVHTLTLNAGSAGGVTFTNTVGGGGFALASLTATTSTGGGVEPVAINGVGVTTTGGQGYGTLILGGAAGAATTLTSNGGTGAITSGAVTGAAHPLTVSTTGTGSSSTFGVISDAGAAVDFEVGGIATFNGAITASSFALGTTFTNPSPTTTRGVFNAGGTTVATTLGQTYNEEVYLGAGTTLTDPAGGAISLKAVDSATAVAPGQTLTVNTSGATTFGGLVGAINALASVTTDYAGAADAGTRINGGGITTTGAQLYNDAVTLGATGAATTLNAGSGAVTFVRTLQSAGTTTPQALSINTTGLTTFGGAVGGSTIIPGLTVGTITTAPALYSLSVSGPTAINGGSVTTITTAPTVATPTSGLQTYTGQVTLGANTTLQGYSATFGGGITEATPGTYSLTLNFAGQVTLPGTNLLTNVGDFTSEGGGGVLINNSIQTYGSQTYSGGPVVIAATAPTNLSLTAGTGNTAGSITLNAPLDDSANFAHNLTLTAGSAGGVTIGAGVGATHPLGSLLAATRMGGTAEPVKINAQTVAAGTQSYGTLTLGGTGATTLTSTLANGSIISGAVTGAGHVFNVNVTGTGGTSTFAAISDAGAAVDFEVAGIATFNGAITASSFALGTTFTNPATTTRGVFNAGGTAVATTLGQTYNEEVYLGAGTTFADSGASAISFKGIDSATAVVPGQALVVNTGGVTTFGGLVGASNALGSVTTDAVGTTQINGTSIVTNGAVGQVFHDDVTLGANTTLNAGTGAVTFDKTLASATTPRDLTITTSGLTTLTGQVGGTSTTGTAALASLTTSTGEVDIATGVTTLATTQGALSGDQTYGGLVRLTGNTTLQGHTLTLATAGLLGQGHDLLLNFTTQFNLRNTAPRAITGVGTFETDGVGGVLITGTAVGDAFTTTGTHTYNGGPVKLAGTPGLTSTAGSLVFNVPVDSNAGNVPLALSATGATGQVVFNGSTTAPANALVGNGLGLGAFTSNTGNGTIFNMNAGLSTSGKGGLNAVSVAITGPVTFNEAGSTLTAATHPSILTTGAQTYTGAATLARDTSLVSSGGGAIGFTTAAATINSASGTPRALNTSTTGVQTFTGLIGNLFALGSLDGLTGLTTGTGGTIFNMAIPTSAPAGVRVQGPVTTTGPVTFNVTYADTTQASILAHPTVLTLGSAPQTYGTLTNPVGTAVTLAGPYTVLNSANTEPATGTFIGGGRITFNGNIVGVNGAEELDVRAGEGTAVFTAPINTSGNFAPGGADVVFNGSVGPLGTFTVLPNTDTGAGMVDLNVVGSGVSVTTGGSQLYTPRTVLSTNTTLQAGGNVTFVNTLDGDVSGGLVPHSLGITSGGTISFQGQVGGLVPLLSLTTANLGAANATTLFGITLPTSLTGRLPGAVNVLNAVAINTSFADFETGPLAGSAPTILSGVTFNSVVGTGTQTYGAAVTVGKDTVLQDLATAGGIIFNGKIDAKTDGVAGLSVNAVGNETFGQLVGSTFRLSNLSTDDLGTVGGSANFQMYLTPAGTLAGVRTTGAVNINDQVNFNATGGTTLPTILSGTAQSYQRAATLTQNAVLTANSGNITFFGPVDSAAATPALPRALTVNTPGNEIFQGLVGSSAPLLSLSTDATGTPGGQARFVTTQSLTGLGAGVGAVNTTGTVTINDAVLFQVAGVSANHPTVASGGMQTYAGAATLGENTVLTSTGGSILFSGTVDSATAATPRDLTTNTPTATGFVTFAQPVGSLQPLASLTTAGAGTTQINGGRVNTTGDQEYLQSVTLGQNTLLFATAPGASIDFTRSLDGAFNLETTSTDASFRAVGNTTPLVNLTVNAPGSILFTYDPTLVLPGTAGVNVDGQFTLNGPAVFDATAASGGVLFVRTGLPFMGGFPSSGQSYQGSFALAGTATFTDNHGGGIVFFQTADGLSSTSLSNLTASTDGTIEFRGPVGAGTPLTSLTTTSLTPGSGRTILSGSSVATVNRGTPNATGAQTYNNAVSLGSDMVLTSTPAGGATTGGDITFVRTLDSDPAPAPAQALTVNTSGRTIFGGAVGAANALASLTTDYEGMSDLGTFINGASVRTTSAQTYNDGVTLGATGAATTLTSDNNGDITFARTLDSNAPTTPQALIVNTGGQTIFGGAVGAANALASLTTDLPGTTQINGGSVTTTSNGMGATGAQTYNDAVTLGADTVLKSTVSGAATVGGALTFNGTLDGGFSLMLNTSGLTIFNQAVGNTTALTALTTDATGSTQFNMPVGAKAGVVVAGPVTINDPVLFSSQGATPARPTILTLGNGSQTYIGAATLSTSTYLVSAAGPGTGGVYSGGGSILFNSASGVSSLGGPVPVDLYVRAGLGAGTIAGSITARDADLGGALVNFAGPVNLSGTFSVEPNGGGSGGSLTFTGGSVTTTGVQNYNTALVLGNTTVLTSAGSDITFNGRIDGGYGLTVNTPGNETFNGQVGGITPLLSLTTDAAGSAGGRVIFGFAGTTAAPSVTTVNAQTYNDAATLLVDTTLASTAGSIAFARTIGSAVGTTRALTLNAAGNETFNGQVGGVNPLASLVTDDANGTISGGQVIFNVAGVSPSVTTTGLQTYNDAVTLQAATTLTSLNNGRLTFASTVNGAFALNLNTTGVTMFRGAVGGLSGSALASLTTQTGEVDINGGAVTTTGVQSYGGAVVLGADTLLRSTAATGGGITFGSTLGSDAAGTPRALTISSVGPTRFAGVVGGNNLPLASLTTQGVGTVAINGGAVTTVGTQNYGGAVTLGADTTLTSTAAMGGGITFGSTLGSDAAGTPRALTISSVGPTRFAGVVGGNNLPLASLTTQGVGTVAINGGAVTTVGTQNYGGAVTLGADTLLRTTGTGAGGQSIVFNDAVSSDAAATPRALTLDAPGDEVFGGSVGGNNLPLLTLTTTNTGRVVFGINGAAVSITTTGAQTYNNLAILQAGTTLVSTNAGNLTFASTVDSAANTPYALTVNTAGDEIFSDSVGGIHPLLSLVTDSLDSKIAGGHAYFGLQTPGQSLIVSTTGQQRYNDSVVLRANLLFASTNTGGDNGSLVFGSTVDSGKGDFYTLTLNTPGDEVFNGLVGSGKEIGDLNIDAAGAVGGSTRFNMAAANGQNGVNVRGAILIRDRVSFNPAGQGANAVTILSTGAQTYADAATVAADTVLTSTGTGANGAITFNATVNGPAGLTLNTGGPTRFREAIGGNNAPLGSLVVNGGGTITFDGQVVNTTGLQTYNGPVILGQSTAFSNTGGDITFARTVTGPYDLTLTTTNAGSSTVFEQSVDVNTFTAADGSAVVLAGGNVTTAGLQTYGGTLTITAPGPDGDRTVLMAPATNGGDRSQNGIIFKQDVNVQSGSLVALGYRILSGRQSDITVNGGDLVMNASNLLVLQGSNYLASGRVILNDAVAPAYNYADYTNGDRSQPSPTIYVLNAGRTTTFRGGSFDMGYLQNLYSVGSVAITAVGGGNATLSDIATSGALTVTAGSITLRARDPDPARSNGTDDGLNFVSGTSINFGQSPINYTSSGFGSTNNHANLVTPTGQVTVNRNQTNGVSLFQDPTVRTRFISAEAIGFRFDQAENVSNLFSLFGGIAGGFLQPTSSGSKTQEIAAALSGALPDQKPLDVASDLTVTASQMEELKKLGIHPRTAQKQERLSLASKRALFAQLVDGLDTDNYGRLQPVKGGISRLVPSDYVVVVDRMSEREVQSILTAFEELYGKNKEKAPPIGEAFNTAFTDYSTEKQTADASGFAPYLAAKPGKYADVDKAVRGFDNLFGYIESLGLTPKEQAKSKEHIASDLQVSGVSPEDMVKVIDTLRSKIPKDQKASSTKLPPSPPASNPAPGATNPPSPEKKKGTPPLKTARQGQGDRKSKTVRQNKPKVSEDRLHEVAAL